MVLLAQLRRAVGVQTDDAVRSLTRAWVTAWDQLSDTWTGAIGDVVARIEATGELPTAAGWDRLERLTAARAASERALQALTVAAGQYIGAGTLAIVTATAEAEPQIMSSQLPTRLAASALRRYAARILPSALESIVVRCRQQVTQRLWPLSAEATGNMKRALTVGLAVGDNPRRVAQDMLARTEGSFNGGLARAVNIARTEMLDAYRDTSQHSHEVNADVLDGWIWSATLDRRTCRSCWGMHGTVHPLEQPGPWDHQQGRCARLPKVKSWRELGIDVDEPDDVNPDAAATFAALDEQDQRHILGPGAYALWAAGAVDLTDMASRRETPEWRPSYVPTTVRRLQVVADLRAERAGR